MEKTDFRKTLGSYQAKHNLFQIVTVPSLQYIMIDGHGDPNTMPAFVEAIETLYPVAYALKFASKTKYARDYVVPPLEGLWWSDDYTTFTSARDKSSWDWTLMLMVPEWVDVSMFDEAIKKVASKKQLKRLNDVRFETLDEGMCVQTMHIGSYDDETPVLAKMHDEFIPQNHLKMVKKHHEIYLGDFRKVAPEKLKTILRQPVEKK